MSAEFEQLQIDFDGTPPEEFNASAETPVESPEADIIETTGSSSVIEHSGRAAVGFVDYDDRTSDATRDQGHAPIDRADLERAAAIMRKANGGTVRGHRRAGRRTSAAEINERRRARDDAHEADLKAAAEERDAAYEATREDPEASARVSDIQAEIRSKLAKK